MLIYKSHYITANYLETRYLLHIQWTKPADLLDEIGYYSEVAKFFKERIKRPGRLILWDFSVIQDRVDSQFFQWIDQHILPSLLSVKIQKVAYILTREELMPSITTGYISLDGKNFTRQIFSEQPQAMQWLTQDAERVIRGPERHHHH